MCISSSFVSFANTRTIPVYLNGKAIDFSSELVKPQLFMGRTYVPLRKVCEAMGISMEWSPTTKWLTFKRGYTVIEHQVPSNTVYVNGEAKKTFFLMKNALLNMKTIFPPMSINPPQNIYFMYLVLDGLVITLKLYMSFLLRNCITTAKKNIKLNFISEKKMWIGSSFLTTTNTKIQVNTLFINLLPNNQIYDTNVGLYFEKTLI